MATDVLRAATVYPTIASIEADLGPPLAEYRTALDMPALFRWVVGSTATSDHRCALGYSGGVPGAWLRVREPIKGSDLTDASVTIYVGGNFWRALPAATLGANRTCTLGTTNAAAGDMITITRRDLTAWTYAVINGGPGAGTLLTFPAGQLWWADFYFDGTNWSCMRAGQMP